MASLGGGAYELGHGHMIEWTFGSIKDINSYTWMQQAGMAQVQVADSGLNCP